MKTLSRIRSTPGGSRNEANARAAPALAEIIDALETDIVFGRLHPRGRLIEDELMARFGAKRHLIRQALVELERMGLVRRERNRGASVADFLPDEVEQIYGVRQLLETAAATQIPMPLERGVLRRLQAIQRRHDQAVKAGDTLAAFRVNNEFHRALFSACGNAYLSEGIGYFAQKTHVIRSHSIARPEYLREARAQHWAMIAALEHGDRRKLVALCARHLDISRIPYIEAHRTARLQATRDHAIG
ncbi:MAG TPA: GntR family transcriptional regulator [Casimicrobiaceae bacterium]|nr:GntR family transcriptional regulator [Casimicrobiaceae bacterium]